MSRKTVQIATKSDIEELNTLAENKSKIKYIGESIAKNINLLSYQDTSGLDYNRTLYACGMSSLGNDIYVLAGSFWLLKFSYDKEVVSNLGRTFLPIYATNPTMSSVVNYRGTLYFFGSNYNTTNGLLPAHMYKYDGETLTDLNTLPESSTGYYYKAFVLDDVLYLISNSRKCYIWDNENLSWNTVGEIPAYDLRAVVCTHKGKLHYIYRDSHYTFDGETWTLLSTPNPNPNNYTSPSSTSSSGNSMYSMTSVGEDIHACVRIPHSASYLYSYWSHYKYDGESWTQLDSYTTNDAITDSWWKSYSIYTNFKGNLYRIYGYKSNSSGSGYSNLYMNIYLDRNWLSSVTKDYNHNIPAGSIIKSYSLPEGSQILCNNTVTNNLDGRVEETDTGYKVTEECIVRIPILSEDSECYTIV